MPLVSMSILQRSVVVIVDVVPASACFHPSIRNPYLHVIRNVVLVVANIFVFLSVLWCFVLVPSLCSLGLLLLYDGWAW